MLGIIVLPLSTTVTCKETRAVIIALHKKGFTINCHDVGLGGWVMTVINTSSPFFLSLPYYKVTFAKLLVNIEILGTSECGGK